MKRYQILYIIGMALIIVAVTIYLIGSLVIVSPGEETLMNLLGSSIIIDSDYSIQESGSAFAALKRFQYRWLLWLGLSAGSALLLLGIWLKRKTEGPDLFIDDELDEAFDE